ncbi:MAG TPA: translation elongation factor Ts [Tepidisphaeraceae bacterium]|nr:translation elongation factor Ts [Tepidisphaeraceae bacterium]
MAQITAAMVNELRNKTGQGMMECKKALTETGGDVEKAIEYFRKKGVKTSITERQAGEGRVGIALSADSKTAAAVEVNCNTDFTAKSELIANIIQTATKKLAANPSLDLKNDAAIKDMLTSAAQQTGENVQLGRTAAVTANNGRAGTYLYAITGKIAVVMAFTGNPDEDLIKQLGGHIAFSRPLALTRAEVPADLVAKERDIAVEQAKATGKPQQIAEKIAEGKLNSFFAERCLLDQEFFNAQVFKGSIANYLKSKNVTLEKYVRMEVGQA